MKGVNANLAGWSDSFSRGLSSTAEKLKTVSGFQVAPLVPGVPAIPLPTFTAPGSAPPEAFIDNANLDAGSLLLSHYETNVANMRNRQVQLAQKAETEEQRFSTSVEQCVGQHTAANRLYIELKTLPEFMRSLSKSQQRLRDICRLVDDLEKALTGLEQEDAILELGVWKSDEQRATEEYRANKGVQLVRLEDQMILERAKLQEEMKLVEERELIKKEKEEERIREAFDHAIHQQLEDFQKYGPIKPAATTYEGLSLDQISVESDSDKKKLEEFLSGLTDAETTEGDSDIGDWESEVEPEPSKNKKDKNKAHVRARERGLSSSDLIEKQARAKAKREEQQLPLPVPDIIEAEDIDKALSDAEV